MSSYNENVDYLVIGHVTRDVVPQGYLPGGTVTYSGRLAHALGCNTAVLTSARLDYDLSDLFLHDQIQRKVIPADADSIFSNIYEGNSRIQLLHSVADRIRSVDVPAEWKDAQIVHLGPLTNEVDYDIVDQFPNSLIGLTPQGWMRRWGDDKRVYATSFPGEERLLKAAAAVVISEEDLLDDEMLDRYIEWSNILVMTQNYAGCTVYTQGQAHQISAPVISLVEPTGAGDIFAAAFFVQLWRNQGDPLEAAAFANHVAAHSVTTPNLDEKVIAWQPHTFDPHF